MTDVRFYHLQRMALERALPKLLEKVLQSGARAVVMVGSEERLAALDTALWTFDPNSFLAHGTSRDGRPHEQPIFLTTGDENPNRASVLVLADGARSQRMADYEKCLEIFDGNDAEAVAAGRERWRAYREAGFALTYWQQDDSGRWQRRE
ncbi:MAG: DNA polymerase III subunit chi [Alphaproteobacteria bacterium]